MNGFSNNDIDLQVTGPEARVKWEKNNIPMPPKARTMNSIKETRRDTWRQAFVADDFKELDQHFQIHLADPGFQGEVGINLTFVLGQQFHPDTEPDLMTVIVREDPKTGKIGSAQILLASQLVYVSQTDGKARYTVNLSMAVQEEGQPLIGRIFWKIIDKVVAAGKAISEWAKQTKSMLEAATDRCFFEPGNGFGLKMINRDGSTIGISGAVDGAGQNTWPTMEDIAANMAKGPALLFIHGIFSNLTAAFEEILCCKELHDHYPGGVYGFDHPTFSVSALDNAMELAKLLPKGCNLDIVCHSRGGLVTRCLLEHPDAQALWLEKSKVHKVIFVAGACKGSPYASDGFLEKFLLHATTLRLIPQLRILASLFTVLARFAHNAPGVTCLDPGSELFRDLFTENNAADSLAFFRANFGPDLRVIDAMDEIAIDRSVFKGAANDVIVPFNTANIASDYRGTAVKILSDLDFNADGTEQDKVWHLNYFKQPEVQEKIIAILTGNEGSTTVGELALSA